MFNWEDCDTKLKRMAEVSCFDTLHLNNDERIEYLQDMKGYLEKIKMNDLNYLRNSIEFLLERIVLF